MKCKQTVYNLNKEEKIRIQTDCCKFFPLFNQMIEFPYNFSKHNSYWDHYTELNL